TLRLLILMPALWLAGCSLFDGRGGDRIDTPSLETLRAAPLSVTVDGTDLVLRTAMWRDFMPVSPPDGRGLIAIFYVATIDSSDIPARLTATAGFVVNGDDVWATEFTGETPAPSENKPFQLVEFARNGPKFGPDIYVDAVVRLEDESGHEVLLRAADQFIGATY
ncbi:MAG: hypothetical protein HKN17_10855, partial [Rhodothermales bacterium]|nr:hypothetical protein [Rhodothermales bacterium]